MLEKFATKRVGAICPLEELVGNLVDLCGGYIDIFVSLGLTGRDAEGTTLRSKRSGRRGRVGSKIATGCRSICKTCQGG